MALTALTALTALMARVAAYLDVQWVRMTLPMQALSAAQAAQLKGQLSAGMAVP